MHVRSRTPHARVVSCTCIALALAHDLLCARGMRALLVAVILTGACHPFANSAPDASDASNGMCEGPAPTGQGTCDCTPTGWRCNSCGGFSPPSGACEPGDSCHYEDWEHGCSCACNAEGRWTCSKDTIGSTCPTGDVSDLGGLFAVGPANTSTSDELAPTVSGDGRELLYVGPTADLWGSLRGPLDAFQDGERRDDLSTAGDERDPELSADGLSVLFVRDDEIVIATRTSTTSAWSGASAVPELVGFGAPSLGTNDLHIVLTKDGALYEASRVSTSAPWSTPIEISELADAADDGGPSLSRGGLELVFHSNRGGTYQLWRAQRPALDQPFSPAVPIELGIPTANVRDPELSRDGLTVYCAADIDGTQDLYLAKRTAL